MNTFNGKNLRHRLQMLQLIHALAMEINTGLSTKVNFFHHAKNLGWVGKSVRTRRAALRILVDLAVKGFGYVPKGRINSALAAKRKGPQLAKVA